MPAASSCSVMVVPHRAETVGGVTSSTVTVAVMVEVLPLPSVAVRTTWFAPTFEQSKSVMSVSKLSVVQLSVVPSFTASSSILTIPVVASSWTVMSCVAMTGSSVSSTSTNTMQIPLLPLPSWKDTETSVAAPRLAQSKSVWPRISTATVVEQLSVVEPRSASVRVASPLLSRLSVMVEPQLASSGSVTSSTVTVAEHIATLPASSMTIRFTVLSPILLQSKLDTLAFMVAIPQLSVEPPSMSEAVIVADPLSFSWMVMFWQTAIGAVSSETVTAKLQVVLSPAASVAVSVTTVVPRPKVSVRGPAVTAPPVGSVVAPFVAPAA